MADLTAEDLGQFLGLEVLEADGKALQSALTVVTGMVDAYTRGRSRTALGDYRPGVREVILSAAARLAANPGQVSWKEQSGAFSVSRGEGFSGFTLAEQFVLNRYRKRGI